MESERREEGQEETSGKNTTKCPIRASHDSCMLFVKTWLWSSAKARSSL